MTTLELNPIPAGEAPAASPAPPPGTSVSDIVKKALAANLPIDTLTSLYLKLRAAKDDLNQQAKSKLAPINEGMDALEAHFLAKMTELGVDSLKNAAGTPYKTEKVSITVADNAAFVDYTLTRALSGLTVSDAAKAAIKQAIIDSGQLALIEARASKSAVEALLEETHELPPGLNRRSEYAVNVRSS